MNGIETKYLKFLDFLLLKLRNGRESGIQFRNILKDYKNETGIFIEKPERKEFIQIYDGKWFDKISGTIDRLKIRQESIEIMTEYGSIAEYLRQKNQSFLKNDLQNNTKTQKSEIKKQLTKTTTTISKVITALIITVIGGVIILIVWGLWGTQIMNFLKPLP